MVYPLIYLLSSYISGIVSGKFYTGSRLILIPFFFLSLLPIAAYRSSFFKKFSPKLSLSIIFIYFLGFGAMSLPGEFFSLSQTTNQSNIVPTLPKGKVKLTGVIIKPSETFPYKTRIYLKTKAGSIRVTVYDKKKPKIEVGDIVSIKKVKLKKPRNFKNPGMFDYEAYMRNRGILLTGSTSKANNIKILKKGTGIHPYNIIFKARSSMSDFLKNVAPSPEKSVLRAVLLGEKNAISNRLRERFKETGLSHLLAVSGLHVGFLATLVFFLIKNISGIILLNISPKWVMSGNHIRLSAILTIIPVIFYAILTGAGISTIRAAIMVTTYLFSIALYRDKDVFNTAMFAAFLILLYKPSSLFDIGFQLSFTAVFGIICIHKKTHQYMDKHFYRDDIYPERTKYLLLIISYLTITSALWLITTPLILYYFHYVSPYSIFTNLLVLPIVSILIPTGLASCLIAFISLPLAAMILKIPIVLTSIVLKIIKIFGALPFSSIYLPPPNLVWIFLIYAFLIFIYFRKETNKNHAVIFAASAIAFIFINLLFSPSKKNGLLEVTFIDVGEGSAAFLKFPQGKTMLIDGGSNHRGFDMGEKVIIPYLFSQDISSLDYLIGSHPDNDHIGGLYSVIKRLNVGIFFDNGYPKKDRMSYALKSLAEKKGVVHKKTEYPDILTLDSGITIETLSPVNYDKTIENLPSDNNLSVVTKVNYNNISFLFTGDIERETEKKLLKYCPKLKSTIIQIPHHGSKSSSTKSFLEAVNPEIAIASAGFNNRFHHPNKRVVKRYAKQGIKLFRTDMDGAITIKTDGLKYWVSTF